jgi:chromosome segregation ATPase
MYDSLGEISSSIKATVQTKVITEMESLVEQMKSNERTQLDGIAVAVKKVDSLQDDMKDIKQGVENGVGSMKATVDSVREEAAALREEIQNLKAQRDTDNVAAQYALTEVRFSQDIHRDALSDYKVSVSNSLSRMEQTVQSSEEFLNKLVKDVDEKAARTLTTVMEAKDNIKDFKLLYEFDMEDVKVSVRSVTDTVTSFADRVDSIEAYLKPLQEMDAEATLRRLDASLEETIQRFNDIQKTVAETTTQVERVNKSVHALQGEVNARIPDQFSAQAERADKLSEDIQSSEEAIKILDALLKQAQHKIGEFAAVRNDLDLVKENLTQTEQRLKTVHNNMSVVMDSSIEHEKRIEVLTETLEKSEETAMHRMEEVKESLLELLTEKQAEIDADVKNLRESLDMATGANEAGGAYDNVGSSSSFASKGTAPSAGGMTSLSTLPTRSGVGLGVTSVTTTSGQTSTTSTKERQMQLQRLPARGVPRNPAVNVGGVVVTVEDQRVATQSQAEVMAELCVNLEEIAVQKSMVPELPPSMCEQVTASAQSLTAFMASCSDAEVVQKALRSHPYDVVMEEDNVSDNRQLKMDNFVAEVMALVISQNPQPGIIRLETREKFEKQLRKALSLCMSKHNQVLTAL